MGLTFAEKVLSKKAGKKVKTGEIVDVAPDRAMSHDNAAAISKTFDELGVDKIFDPEVPVIILDHCVPAANEKYASNHKRIREFVKKHGIKHFFDVGYGVCHQILAEKGFSLPGELLVGSDSHTPSAGAFGAFACGIGRSEMAVVWATGRIWLKVPSSLKIEITGIPKKWISAKDIALHIIGEIGADGALYKSVEFTGDTVEKMDIGERFVLCNLAAEMGAKNAVCSVDDKVLKWLKGRASRKFSVVSPDPDADYEQIITVDVSDIEPKLACPHTVDNVTDVKNKEGTKIDQVLIGTCTNGRLEDLRAAAEILDGKKVHPSVRLLVVPASREIFSAAIADGTIAALNEAGAVILNPGCGPCLGAHQGVPAPGEVCLSTANRNFKGRMGCKEAEIYLCSPAVAAASAVAGEITTPENL